MTTRRVKLLLPETGSHDQAWEAYTKLKKTHSRLVDFEIKQKSRYNTAKFRLYKHSRKSSKDTIKLNSAFRIEQKMVSFFDKVESKLEPEKSEKDQLKQENQQLKEQNQEFHEELSELKSEINEIKENLEQLTRMQEDKAEKDRSDTVERAEDLYEEAGLDEPQL